MRKFTTLWAGYLVSMLGSSLTSLALGVWVLQQTGSATLYGLVIVMSFLPSILISPLAGALVDRWSRKAILATGNGLCAVAVLTLAAIYTAGALEPWHILIGAGVLSLLQSPMTPTMNSVVILLVPRHKVERANGLVLLAQALGGTVGFAAAGVLLVTIGLDGVLLLDGASFAFNMLVVLAVAIPRPRRTTAGAQGAGRLVAEIKEGWRYVSERRGLVSLIAFYATVGFAVAPADVLITPVVLAFASAAALGVVLGAAGTGAVLGSLALTSWGGPRRRIHGLAGFTLPIGAFMCLGASRPSVVLLTVAAFGYSLFSTVVDGTTRGILQLEVEPDMQGRVFATFNMVATAVRCVGYFIAGPLVDHAFGPLLGADGALAGSVGRVIGVGDGRGAALLVLLCGLAVIATATVAYRQPGLRGFPDRRASRDDGAGEPLLPASVPAGPGTSAESTDVRAVAPSASANDGWAAGRDGGRPQGVPDGEAGQAPSRR